jgi:RecA-family ATPase
MRNQPDRKEPLVQLRQYRLRDEITIPRRSWLMPGMLMRKQVAALVAAGGVGKSILSLTIAMHHCAGRNFGPWKTLDKYRIAVLSTEEDETELDRRLHAIAKHYGFSQEDADRLFLIQSGEEPVLARANYNGLIEATDLARKMTYEAHQFEVDAVVGVTFLVGF